MFEVPITVVRPEPLKSEPRPQIEHKDILFAPGDIKRHFIKPPEGSTWAVVRVVSQEKAATGKFVLHTVQLSPGKSVMNNNHEKMFSLSDLGEWSYGLAVQGRIGIFITFPTHFSVPIIFSNLNSNCSNLSRLRNLQEQVKKAFFYQKLF